MASGQQIIGCVSISTGELTVQVRNHDQLRECKDQGCGDPVDGIGI